MVVGLVVAIVSDAWLRRMSWWLTLGTAAVVLALRFATQGVGSLETGLISGVVSALGAAMVFSGFAFRRRGLEWVDVSLLAAMGAGLGFPLVLPAMLGTSVSGAVLAVVFSICNGTLSATLRRVVAVDGGVVPQRPRMPYSLAIAVGSLWAMWWDRAS